MDESSNNEEDAKRITEIVYSNDLLMEMIVARVENFKDRNSLELTSRRLRAICLQTAITRRARYMIHLEGIANVPRHQRILKRTPPEMTYSVRSCSDAPKEEQCVLVRYNCRRGHECDTETFFNGIIKRLFKQICEFEVKNQKFGQNTLEYLMELPNLRRFVFRSERTSPPVSFPDHELNPDGAYVSEKIHSLTYILDQYCSTDMMFLKSMIGPGLKHLALQVTPDPADYTWFIEEVMVELALHNVQLETCQLVFSDPKMPRNHVTALTHFMTERSKILKVTVANQPADLIDSTWSTIIPTLTLDFFNPQDTVLNQLYDGSPVLLHKVEALKVSNIHPEGMKQLAHVLPNCRSLNKLLISTDSKLGSAFLIDQVFNVLPSSIEDLSIHECKLSPNSMDLIVSRLSSKLIKLSITGKRCSSTVQNFSKILTDLKELEVLVMDMSISHLLFPKIIEHQNLKQFVCNVEGNPINQSLIILEEHFEKVELSKQDGLNRLVCSKP